MLTNLRKKYRYIKNIQNCDSIIISFPKSGRTLLRFMLGLYLKELFSLDTSLKEITNFKKFHTINQLPFIFFDHFGNPHLISYKKINKTNLKPLHYKTKIFLHRDPRHQVYSNYFQFFFRGDCKKVDKKLMPSRDIEEFIFGEIGGLKSISKYYELLNNFKFKTNMLFISYKEMIKNKKKLLKQILEFLNFEVDTNILEMVVEKSSKENMAILEKKGLLNDYHFGGKNDKDSKVNKNRPKWNEFLNDETIEKMNLFCYDNFDKKFLEF